MTSKLDMSKMNGNRHTRRAAAAGASVPPPAFQPQIGVAPTWNATIGIPSTDMVHANFAMALAAMCTRTPGRFALMNAKSSIVAKGRNDCVEASLKLGTSHLLFLDSDMVFPQDTLLRLVSHDKDIVGGTYVMRAPPHKLLGSRLDDGKKLPEHGLVPMAEMPTGCLLIKTEVFRQMEAPWFRYGINLETGGLIGEDIAFCRMAVERGFEIWCDAGLSRELIHIGQYGYGAPEMEQVAEQLAQLAAQEAAPT